MHLTNTSTNPSFADDDDTNSYSQSFASAEHTNVHLETCFNLKEFSLEFRSDSTAMDQFLPTNKMDIVQNLEKHCLRELYGDCMSESLPSASFKKVSVREDDLTLASTLFATDNENVGCHEEIQGEYYKVHYTYIQLTEINYGNGIIFRCIRQRS